MSTKNENPTMEFGLEVKDNSGTMNDVYAEYLPKEVTIEQVEIIREYDDVFAAGATEAALAHGEDVTISDIKMGPRKTMGIVVTDGNPVIAITADVNEHLALVIATSKLVEDEE